MNPVHLLNMPAETLLLQDSHKRVYKGPEHEHT